MSKSKKNQKLVIRKEIPLPAQPKKQSFPFHHLMAIVLIVGVAFIAYSNTFYVPFQFDDRANIHNNPNIQMKALTWERVGQFIKNTYQVTIRVFSYFTLALNYYFREFNVFGYHLVNFFIHIGSGIFLYWFLILTFNLPFLQEKYGSISYQISLFASLIFVSHPIQTQAVTYIVQRMASMAGMFYLLSMVLYIKGRLASGPSRIFYFGGVGLSYLLGVFSKENVAILPLFIALYEFYFFQNLDLSPRGKRIVFYLVGALLILGAFGLVLWGPRYYNEIVEGYQIRDFTLEERVLTQFRVVLYYVTLLVFPHPSRLNLDYDFSTSRTIFDPPTTLISILIIAGLIGYSLWITKRKPVFSYFVLWYFGNLVIESSIFPLEMVYEHRLYLPAVGPFVLFSLMTVRGIEKWRVREAIPRIEMAKPRFVETFVFLVVIVLLFMGTYLRNETWNDEIGLWKDCLKKSPQKARPYANLGFAYLDAGIYDQALQATQHALQIDPKFAYAYYNMSIIYQKMGDLKQATDMGKKALEIDPDFHMAHYSLGEIYFEKGEYQESVEAYKRFLEVFPNFPNVHHLLGIVYAAQRQIDKAMKEFEYEIRVNPYHALAHLNLGQIYWYELRKKQKALDHLKTALFLDPLLPNRGEIRRLVHLLEGFP